MVFIRPENRSKYNVDTKDVMARSFDGITFDSILEMKYYRDVILPQVRSGDIISFELQKEYTLQPKFKYGEKTVQPILYVADFFITYKDGSSEVIDTKGYADSTAKMKRKMFWYLYPNLPYRWICYSKIDGNEENKGWCDYDYVKSQRQKRKSQRKEQLTQSKEKN